MDVNDDDDAAATSATAASTTSRSKVAEDKLAGKMDWKSKRSDTTMAKSSRKVHID